MGRRTDVLRDRGYGAGAESAVSGEIQMQHTQKRNSKFKSPWNKGAPELQGEERKAKGGKRRETNISGEQILIWGAFTYPTKEQIEFYCPHFTDERTE